MPPETGLSFIVDEQVRADRLKQLERKHAAAADDDHRHRGNDRTDGVIGQCRKEKTEGGSRFP